MVKRKKNGLIIFEDDKRYNESTLDIYNEEMPSSENNIDPTGGSSSQSKNRAHATRTSLKETCGTIESSECDVSVAVLEKDQKILPCQRYSNRVPKRPRKDTSPGENPVKKSVVSLKQNVQLRSKTRRPWELWSVEDKNAFFEALCEFGKDFESIQSYIAQRSKKKGIPTNMIKNKDQVRHFYYRTWHKISKYLEISDNVRKQTQEIYGLINYAELRKKIGSCLSEKNSHKLNELVFNGVTTVKYKGKKLRIKTPVCRALKKLSNVSETKEPGIEKLPKEIMLELRPRNNHAWLYVQNLAQNPRVRTKISLQCRLKSVIEYLQNKWKPCRLKRKEQMLSGSLQLGSSLLAEDPVPTLCVKPCNSSLMRSLSISVLDSASSSDVCLEKYLKVSREPVSDKETSKKKPRPKLKTSSDGESSGKPEDNALGKMSEDEMPEFPNTTCDQNADDNYSINLLTPPKSVEEEEDCCENVIDEAQRSLSLLSSMLNSTSTETPAQEPAASSAAGEGSLDDKHSSFNCTTIEEMYLNKCQEAETLTLGQILSLNSKPDSAQPCENASSGEDILSSKEANVEELFPETSEQQSKNDTEGSPMKEVNTRWTASTAGLLTVGELYLMLGQPSKIVLEYEFEFSSSESRKDSDAKNENDNQISPSLLEDLADVMRKLIEVASSTFSEFKNKQTPLSPVYRSGNSHVHIVPSSHSASKSNPRCVAKSTNLKTLKTIKSSNTNSKAGNDGNIESFSKVESASSDELCSTTNCLKTVCSDGVQSPSDNHVFVVPVGTAPRIVKKPTQESLQEEIDKLLPGTRRGCRVRRKPLVVQRPLLPRDGSSVTGSRPMTVVHLVPSASQLTAVIPPTTCAVTNKSMLPPKQIVEVRSAGPSIAPCPLQVPLLKGISNDSGVLLPKQPVEAHLIVGSPKPSKDYQNMTTVIDSLEKRPIMITSIDSSHTNIPDASPLSLPKNELLHSSSAHDELITSSPPQISIPDTSSCPSVASGAESPAFLGVAMVEELASESIKLPDMDQISGVTTTELSLPSVISSENTPPQSPPNTVRIHSPGPEAQWLNGESEEFSLNTLLNTLESPSKVMPVSSSVNATNENSNSDAITRLAPVVDSEVRCLLEECSVDFIAKFEDLADVINSSNNENKSV